MCCVGNNDSLINLLLTFYTSMSIMYFVENFRREGWICNKFFMTKIGKTHLGTREDIAHLRMRIFNNNDNLLRINTRLLDNDIEIQYVSKLKVLINTERKFNYKKVKMCFYSKT